MGRARTWTRAAVVLLAVAGGALAGTDPGQAAPAAPAAPPPAWNPARPLTVAVSGADGVSRAVGEGLGCDGATPVEDVHLGLGASLPAGTLSSAPATLTGNLGLAGTRLEPATSHVTLGDERGTVRLRLDGGACPGTGNLAPDGDGLAGSGPASLLGATGSYRDATLTGGSWTLSTGTDPGADNPWTLALGGQLAPLAPGLQVQVLGAYWGNLGLDYVSRIVTVQLRVTNPGPGDSYDSAVTGVSAGPGVTVLGSFPQPLGDLLAGESRVLTVRYQLALLGPPCQLVLLGCSFGTTVKASLPDALDGPTVLTAGAAVTAPDLPPPL